MSQRADSLRLGIHSPGAGALGRRQAGLRHVKTVVAQRVAPGGSWDGRLLITASRVVWRWTQAGGVADGSSRGLGNGRKGRDE
ncbi:hypothetical protein E2C01_009826 [Portunus trituberculatus]|uniref:Uncharacterized protein n=1 Tax=Portunus trituberculatus TaxID=210409 RepID=A0A5B7D6S1_PORTR|nr:hypothetical protein [Portunus trituberculatus]